MSLATVDKAEPLGDGIRITTANAVRTIWFDRPDRRNAMTLNMFRSYYTALADADGDPTVRAIVVTGVGDYFCSGADPSALDALLEPEHQEQLVSGLGFEQHLPATLGTPIVAAVNGGAAGLGLVHALYADVRFVADDARLATAFSRLGLIAEYGCAWLLPRLVGPAAALDLLLSGRKVNADEALRIGLAQRVLPRDQVLGAAQTYASELATGCSPTSMAVIRRQVWSATTGTIAEAAGEALGLMVESLRGPDFREALAAAAEQRRPAFPDRADRTDRPAATPGWAR